MTNNQMLEQKQSKLKQLAEIEDIVVAHLIGKHGTNYPVNHPLLKTVNELIIAQAK